MIKLNKVIQYLLESKYGKIIPDKVFLKMQYRTRMGKKLNIDNPESFNEKMQWLKLQDRKPEYEVMVDKYAVRKFIKEKLGEEYLIPLLGVWEKFEDIDFASLPNQFVLKCTHDSGGLIICSDKSKLDIKAARSKINKCLKKNYYYHGREWPYKNIKPKIIAEQYMIDESGYELKDYKVMCFNGKPKCSFVCLNRKSSSGLNVNFYDLDWNLMPFERHYPNSNQPVKKPCTYDLMLKIAEILSIGLTFVRIDFYEINGNLYFGEITFYPGSGYEEFTPEKYDKVLGSWIELPRSSGGKYA